MATLPLHTIPVLLMLASASVPATGMADSRVQCSVPMPPSISITPVSEDIQYDFSVSSRDLSHLKTDTVSPFPAGTDSATGGLRVDQPIVVIKVKWGEAVYPSIQQTCLWYDNVNVTITLRPHIYIAKEYNNLGPCRDAIMAHELRHVDVDREMMNKYAYVIGQAVREVVDGTGAQGPFPDAEADAAGQGLITKARDAVNAQEVLLQQEMNQRQAQVDSLDEYKRISAICYGVGK